MKVSDLHIDPTLTPERDEKFMRHMSAALAGSDPIYFAAVPTSICIPFDQDYRPDLHPVGSKAIEQAAERGKMGNYRNLIVYQRGYWFIVSDDYIPYFASLMGFPDYLPCLIIGKPDHPLVKDIQGPINPAEFKIAIGL